MFGFDARYIIMFGFDACSLELWPYLVSGI